MAARRVVRQTGERGCSNPIKSKEVLQTPSKKPIIWAADNDMTETRLTFRSLLTEQKKCVVRILQALMSETAHRQKFPHSTAYHRSTFDASRRQIMSDAGWQAVASFITAFTLRKWIPSYGLLSSGHSASWSCSV
jgi:hypothetical protein